MEELGERFEEARIERSVPIDARPQTANHGLRLAIVSSALMLLLAFFLTLKPTSARAAWAEFARIIELKGGLKGTPPAVVPAESSEHLNANLADMAPQHQAEFLVEEAVNHNEGSLGQIASRMDGWRGQLTMSPRLTAVLSPRSTRTTCVCAQPQSRWNSSRTIFLLRDRARIH